MTESVSDKRLDSKDALISAAESLFVEKGYEGVSTREIAESAGVNLGAIQYHFGSKAKLFIETVHHMMRGSACARAHLSLTGEISSKREAALKLCVFISAFMNYILRSEGPQACRLMFREIFTRMSNDEEMFEALVSSVVNEFTRPADETLQSVLKWLMPKGTSADLEWVAQSVIGQCTFYLSHRPFIERLRGVNCADSPYFEEVAARISLFSLRAIQCDPRIVSEVIKDVFPSFSGA
jgi:AcrR family transcriptional regulator